MLSMIARGLLRLGGWEAVGGTIEVPKAVVIAAPHTSNWDGVWAMIYKVAVGLDVRFFGKASLFWFPLGSILRVLGGIPLNRDEPGAAVSRAVEAFEQNDAFYFGLAPEGTRALRPHWKTGFYRIATQANVPIVLAMLDFGRKRIGLGPVMHLSGDREADMKIIREFYADIHGRWPEKASPVKFPD